MYGLRARVGGVRADDDVLVLGRVDLADDRGIGARTQLVGQGGCGGVEENLLSDCELAVGAPRVRGVAALGSLA